MDRGRERKRERESSLLLLVWSKKLLLFMIVRLAQANIRHPRSPANWQSLCWEPENGTTIDRWPPWLSLSLSLFVLRNSGRVATTAMSAPTHLPSILPLIFPDLLLYPLTRCDHLCVCVCRPQTIGARGQLTSRLSVSLFLSFPSLRYL